MLEDQRKDDQIRFKFQLELTVTTQAKKIIILSPLNKYVYIYTLFGQTHVHS
jgi:hypothetical protein